VVKNTDRYIIINSYIPRNITLYDITNLSNNNGYTEASPITIRSMVCSGNHKILACKGNNINGLQPSIIIESYKTITLIPCNGIWITHYNGLNE